MRRLPLIGLAAALAAAAGCGRGDTAVTPHPVSGQVVYDGKPADGVRVTFYPEDAPGVPDIPRNPHGVTGPDGKFTLTTFADGDGAAEGSYRVLLDWPPAGAAGAEEGSEHGEEEATDRLRGWYDLAHTPLRADVKAGANNLPAFSLPKVTRPAGAVEGIPGRN